MSFGISIHFFSASFSHIILTGWFLTSSPTSSLSLSVTLVFRRVTVVFRRVNMSFFLPPGELCHTWSADLGLMLNYADWGEVIAKEGLI